MHGQNINLLCVCDVYVGGKVRVAIYDIFRFTTPWIKIKLCIISKTVVKLKSTINNDKPTIKN